MINIDKIPGFEKTPEEYLEFANAWDIYKLGNIELPISENNFYENAKAVKKLLDDRRELLDTLICAFNSVAAAGINLISAQKIIEKITGKTWEELNP